MISAFHADFKSAMERANKLDQKIREDAEKISSDYADIVELSIRQAFAATELTIAENDPADVLMFMKGAYRTSLFLPNSILRFLFRDFE